MEGQKLGDQQIRCRSCHVQGRDSLLPLHALSKGEAGQEAVAARRIESRASLVGRVVGMALRGSSHETQKPEGTWPGHGQRAARSTWGGFRL